MSMEKVTQLLHLNPPDDLKEMRRLLVVIASNILNNKNSNRFKQLQKNNKILEQRILKMNGGHDILILMGFTEHETSYSFIDSEENYRSLTSIKQYLEDLDSSQANISFLANRALSDDLPSVEPKLPRLDYPIQSNKFLSDVVRYFHRALLYADEQLKQSALRKIPLADLNEKAERKMRQLGNNQLKEDEPKYPEVSMQELVLLELLKWFKEEFFSWVNAPDCDFCAEPTHLVSNEFHPQRHHRIEVYECNECSKVTKFERYEDLNVLLITLKGRCGEWANVFTLMCHAMSWEARRVHDETDHVWTEVFIPTRNQWIHCDPCENLYDAPLIYEHGWKKKLSYVIAYSPEEIQDVTWRYSSNHRDVLARRSLCREEDLVQLIVNLRNMRLKTMSEKRKTYILKRTLNELVDLSIEKKPTKDELHGRISGSLQWRIARGETQKDEWKPSTFELTDDELANDKFIITYSSASDEYEMIGKNVETIKHWHQRVYNLSNVIRKEEQDWKQVYLCRSEGSEKGLIVWKVVLRESVKKILSVTLKMDFEIFESGKLDVTVKGDYSQENLTAVNHKTTMAFRGSKCLLIEACLTGGDGPNAWQHAQLFRQPMNSEDNTFELILTFE